MKLPFTATESERIWLETAYKHQQAGDPVNPAVIMLECNGKIPTDFTVSNVNPIFREGNRLSLAGILVIEPGSGLIADTECVIRSIRDLIRETPVVAQGGVYATVMAERLGFDRDYVEKLFVYMCSIGHFMVSATARDSFRYIYISIDDEEVIGEYLSFDNLEKQLDRHIKRRQEVEARSLGLHIESPPVEVKAKTAFILMQMTRSRPELEDVCNTIKDVCALFGIRALRADDIEHQDRSTDVVLDNIRRSEFLIADLTGERPNVYYEVGYAHALNKKPILFRRAGTPLHFDLSVHNAPEYENLTDLREKLTRRLEAILGRSSAG